MPSPHTIYDVVKEEYIYSSTAPYGLYRASVSVEGGTGSFPVVNSGRGLCRPTKPSRDVFKKD